MKKKRYTEEQIIGFLREADAGVPVYPVGSEKILEIRVWCSLMRKASNFG